MDYNRTDLIKVIPDNARFAIYCQLIVSSFSVMDLIMTQFGMGCSFLTFSFFSLVRCPPSDRCKLVCKVEITVLLQELSLQLGSLSL